MGQKYSTLTKSPKSFYSKYIRMLFNQKSSSQVVFECEWQLYIVFVLCNTCLSKKRLLRRMLFNSIVLEIIFLIIHKILKNSEKKVLRSQDNLIRPAFS